jgi:hypothetical protein
MRDERQRTDLLEDWNTMTHKILGTILAIALTVPGLARAYDPERSLLTIQELRFAALHGHATVTTLSHGSAAAGGSLLRDLEDLLVEGTILVVDGVEYVLVKTTQGVFWMIRTTGRLLAFDLLYRHLIKPGALLIRDGILYVFEAGTWIIATVADGIAAGATAVFRGLEFVATKTAQGLVWIYRNIILEGTVLVLETARYVLQRTADGLVWVGENLVVRPFSALYKHVIKPGALLVRDGVAFVYSVGKLVVTSAVDIVARTGSAIGHGIGRFFDFFIRPRHS